MEEKEQCKFSFPSFFHSFFILSFYFSIPLICFLSPLLSSSLFSSPLLPTIFPLFPLFLFHPIYIHSRLIPSSAFNTPSLPFPFPPTHQRGESTGLFPQSSVLFPYPIIIAAHLHLHLPRHRLAPFLNFPAPISPFSFIRLNPSLFSDPPRLYPTRSLALSLALFLSLLRVSFKRPVIRGRRVSGIKRLKLLIKVSILTAHFRFCMAP